ncbi:MAG: cytidine deaminase [Sphingobacteriales bacterium SCN 48-20]|jgi:cytidine deaminase|uniref:cytidine deaminase n=1 Tax=Terrimonas ferruginea TaxID=249 RepID=UPI00041FD73A|nr:cytidine deaminase [Terrimonas ferruginea]MBN8784347.1 cytidine deaminase [Terrimonas ferruginea]ODT92515.1 MAG: cytidine deaminase [Sphingobacteriales bacterium SCN 48-20]OJW45783.1 MAG: cytidine deaminase [Sphingobacteriales bacterium 48-107]
MTEKTIHFSYKEYTSVSELEPADAALLQSAREVTRLAYAPYSHFHVGAAARLTSGAIVKGTNQENASYPVTICAERILLGNAAMQYPGEGIDALAISYNSEGENDHPISPCGMCRQALLEYEGRTDHPIRLILSGQEGRIWVIPAASLLLPFAFTRTELETSTGK